LLHLSGILSDTDKQSISELIVFVLFYVCVTPDYYGDTLLTKFSSLWPISIII